MNQWGFSGETGLEPSPCGGVLGGKAGKTGLELTSLGSFRDETGVGPTFLEVPGVVQTVKSTSPRVLHSTIYSTSGVKHCYIQHLQGCQV